MVQRWQSKCVNTEAIDDVFELLGLLKAQRRKRGILTLYDPNTPCVAVESFLGPYESLSDTTYFPVTPRVVSEIRDNHWVSGTPHWGYTNDKKLRLNDLGESAFYSHLKELTDRIERLRLREDGIPLKSEQTR